MDIGDINKVASRKRLKVDAEKLREKVSRETAKVIKLKVAQDTAYGDLKEKLQEVEGNHKRLQQNMSEVQMQHEAISGQYQDELRLRPEILNNHNAILQKLLLMFTSGCGTARDQWVLNAELLVKPIGWDALWKLSAKFCKKFEVRFPCIACVKVTSVDCKALSVCVDVLGVQHETVSLPEMVEDVPLIDLWPTINQRDKSIIAVTTAEFIHLLRFYYNELWMPWDDHDDQVRLLIKLKDRISLWSDLRDGAIPDCAARSIRLLWNSIKHTHNKLRELESSLCEDSVLPPNYASSCVELNARLEELIAKWTRYENSLGRKLYLTKAVTCWREKKNKKKVVALWKGGSILALDVIFELLKTRISNDQSLTVAVTAEEALALEPEAVVVCSQEYDVPEMALSLISICSFEESNLRASEARSCLLTLSEVCDLRQLALHGALVDTVVLMRAGKLTVHSCTLRDDTQPTEYRRTRGVVALARAEVIIENCIFENFYTAIEVHKDAKVELRNCHLRNCGVGIQMYWGARVVLTASTISDCSEHCVRCELDCGATREEIGLEVLTNCQIGSGRSEDILIVQQEASIIE